MSTKLSVEDVVANLEARAAFHGEQEALHAQQEVHHREQRAMHAAELAKVRQHLETFRAAAVPALELARIPVVPPPLPPPPPEALPASGRLMVSKLVRQVVQTQPDGEPFGATAVAAEVNRRYGTHLKKKAIDSRTASDVLRRMANEGAIHLVREGKAFHEALFTKGPRQSG
jgi:fumarylacetoacetate (FAA) hydrolase family protein